MIAKPARELGILTSAVVTIGVVTKPFHFEGQRVCALPKQPSLELTDAVDTLLVISQTRTCFE